MVHVRALQRASMSVAFIGLVFGALSPTPTRAADPIDASLAPIAERYPDGLPRYMTPGERQLPFERPTRTDFGFRSPPTGTIYCPPEYEPQDGLFVAWEGYTSVLTDLAVGITTGDPEATVYVVVDNSSERTSVTNTLTGAGAAMDQVEFLIRTTDSVWIRDYGPRFIYEDGDRAIIDHTYNRPRPNDNLLNDFIADQWGIAQYDIPLTHGGGNFHLFSNGDAFMTDLILRENPSLSEQEVIDLYREYQNLNLTIYPGFPTWYDSTQHIDMWMMPVGDQRIVIGEYAEADTQPHQITEDAVADLESRGYTVYRTPGWQSGGTHYTYTNSVILNDQIFVPYFGGSWASRDAEAVAVFQEALPDHAVVPVYCGDIIHAAGAIHCVVMHVPDADGGLPLRIEFPDGLPAVIPPGIPTTIAVRIEDVAQSYVSGTGMMHYRIDGGEYQESPLAEVGDGRFDATLPATECGATIEYYFSAAGNGDAVVYEPAEAPGAAYASRVAVYTNILDDSFESEQGWTIESFDLSDGAWERGVPAGDGTRGDPVADYDGSGQCYLTANRAGNSDVDGGPTILTSPLLDLTGTTDPVLSYARWLSCDDEGSSAEDFFTVEVSDDDGGRWVTVEDVPAFDGWVARDVQLADYVVLTDTIRIRFTTSDNPNNSITEAAVDAVSVYEISCAGADPDGDFDGDGDVDLHDAGQFLVCLDRSPMPVACAVVDFDADGIVTPADFVEFAANLDGSGPVR